MVWLGRIFFFEWTVAVKWEDVTQVQKLSDGVRFLARNPKSASYDFEKLFNAEKVWANLVSLHNDTIIGKPRKAPTPRQQTRSLRRMNSDPQKLLSLVAALDQPPTALEGTAIADDIISASSRPIYPRSRSVIDRGESSRDVALHATTSQDANNTDVETAAHTTLEEQWSQIREDSTAYSETAVEKHELPCSLQAFFELFVANSAKYSISRYMEENGDEEIQCSQWEMEEDDEGVMTQTRTIEYTHPVSAPMAPPMARARKEQSYKKYGTNGMVLLTRTYVADVPMTDCFYVKDQILAEPGADQNTVVITMSFDIQFVKSNMFKAIISRTTKTEIEKFMKGLAEFMSKNLGESKDSHASALRPTEPLSPPPSSPMASLVLPQLTVALLVCVLMLQLWIIFDVRQMKMDLYNLQQLRDSHPLTCTSPVDRKSVV